MKWLLPFALLVVAYGVADPAASLHAGLAAYGRQDFGTAAAHLKHSLARGTEMPALATYFLGRTYREMGLWALGLHYLTESEERGGSPWNQMAREDILSRYFEKAEYTAVLDSATQDGPPTGRSAYLTGLAAAMLERWEVAERQLRRVDRNEPFYEHSRVSIAQTLAAREDLDGAASELESILSRNGRVPEPLQVRARILLGKIRYLQGDAREARAVFRAAGDADHQSGEVMEGLLISGAAPEEAAAVNVPTGRPIEDSVRRMLEATAARNRGDAARELDIREELGRRLLEHRRAVSRILAGETSDVLIDDLVTFADRLERLRRIQQMEIERDRLSSLPGDVESLLDSLPERPARFAPTEPSFFGVWESVREDPWRRGLVEIAARSRFSVDAFAGGPPDFEDGWLFWRRERWTRWAFFSRALLAIRQWNVSSVFEDHQHEFSKMSADEMAKRRELRLRGLLAALRDSYVGRGTGVPVDLADLALRIDYKKQDLRRLVESVPERSTNPTVSLLGNLVELYSKAREQLEARQIDLPSFEESEKRLLAWVRAENQRLRHEVESVLTKAIEPSLRRETRALMRLEADNEAALSRLYARH